MENDSKKLPSANRPAEAGDFEFVKQDPSRYEQKFDTKPTTYFKDAMRRFVKSKSSVAAFIILSVLILMAIIVPVADQNSIEKPIESAKFLPPKIFSNTGGFLDGTGTVENALLDPATLSFPETSDYKSYGVIGEIETSEGYSDSFNANFSRYAKGGDIVLINEGYKNPDTGNYEYADGGLLSPALTLDLTSTSLNITYNFDAEVNNAKHSTIDANTAQETRLDIYAAFITDAIRPADADDLDSEAASVIPLCEEINLYDQETLQIEDISTKIKESEEFIEYGYAGNSITGHMALIVKAPVTEQDAANRAYVSSATSSSAAMYKATWSDSTRMKETSEQNTVDADDKFTAWSLYPSESRTNVKLDVYHAIVTYGKFRYDYYAAAFGDISGEEVTVSAMNEYIEKGWIESWDWNQYIDTSTKRRRTIEVDPSSFVLTDVGETYCPLRSIDTVTVYYSNELKQYIYYGTGTISQYRRLYNEGLIANCAIPVYLFGTDQNGKDFFKLVFSGLLVSLGLGLLSSIINISVGLIYGAIEGYFGGWTDMIMERFSEILGGMPWIVVMTLIILLLGSNFWTFLLALCLTGWIGMAAETRSQFYRFKGREYVLASRTLGASDGRLIFRHILPNGIGTIITSAVLMIPSVIFTEANLAYLLPGALSLSDTFGVTLSNVQGYLRTYPYLIISASIIMALIMIMFNLFGNGLRDALNPSLKGADE